MAQEPDYPQVTQTEFDLWKDHKVTRAFQDVLEFRIEKLIFAMGRGEYIVSDNADLTLSKNHSCLGEQEGLSFAIEMIINAIPGHSGCRPAEYYDLIETNEEEEDE